MNTRDLLAGVGVGAALAFVLDPDRGRRRRALLTDKVRHAARVTGRGLDATARDIGNRTRGIAAATRGRWSNGEADDDTIVERVRARLGRASSHPRAIDVRARAGEVVLRGPILAREVDDLLAHTKSIPGVRAVVNELEPHDSAEGVPSLQGGGSPETRRLDIMQRRRWAPATLALVSASVIGTAICLKTYARRRHSAAPAPDSLVA